MDDFGNTFRNFVLAMFLGLLLIASLYFSGLIINYAVYKQLGLDFALSTQPFKELYILINFWIDNFQAINLEYENYLIAKIIGAILAPMLFIGFLTWHFRSSLYNLRPYRKKEFVHGDARWATEEDIKNANLISQLCGNKTVEQVSQNKPKFLDFNPASRLLSVSNTQRALLLPQEVINLPRDEQILLIESSPPIKSNKIKYYLDSFFKKRLLPPIPIPKKEPYDMEKLRASFASNKDKGEKQANPQKAQKVITENPQQPSTADSKIDEGVFDS